MTLRLFIAALALASTCSAPEIARAHGIAPVPSTHKLTATSPGNLRAFPVRPVQIRAARGEWECFQVVVRADSRGIKNLKLRPTILATALGRFIGRENVQIFRENFVRVAKPSGNAELKPLWWSDALIPLNDASASTCEAGKAIAFWVAVRTPENTEPGQYYGALDFDIDGEPRTLAVTLNAEKITLPKATMRATVAVYYDVLRDWYKKSGREFSDADWQIQKCAYYDFLLGYRINAYDLPVDWDSPDALKYLQDSRVTSVRLPPLGAPEMQTALQVLEASGAKKKAFYYRIDEPSPEAYPQVLEASKQLRALNPSLKQLVTIHPNEALKDAVDIWCPNIGDALGVGWVDFKRLESERKKGRETWWYTMVEPKFPYPTWLVDDDALAIRSYGWMMARWGISGFVYSMAHGWGPSPLENLQSFADTNGDGTLLYPGELVGEKGPIPSIRLMLLRDAIEDYELLNALPIRQRQKIERQFVGGDGENALVQRTGLDERLSQARSALLSPIKRPAPIADFFSEEESKPVLLGTAPPHIDGTLSPSEWTTGLKTPTQSFARALDDSGSWPDTSTLLTHDSRYLYAAIRARSGPQVLEDSWFALEAAPPDGREKWRFVVTAKGALAVERYTREGRFRVEESGFQGATKAFTGYRDVEMAIPLSLIPGKSWRINALRRVVVPSGAKVILRAFDDAGDARYMPLFRVR